MDGPAAATKYWHRTGDGRIQCDVCPRACRLCQNWDISTSRETATLAEEASPRIAH